MMSDATPLEPELEPTRRDTALILVLLVAWCITLAIGIILNNMTIAGGSVILLLLAVQAHTRWKQDSCDDSEVSSFSIVPDKRLNTLGWLRDKLALFAAVFIVILAIGLLLNLLSNAPDATGVGQGFGALDVWIHMTALGITILTIIVFGKIANGYLYGKSSNSLILIGFLLVVLLVPVVFYAAWQFYISY